MKLLYLTSRDLSRLPEVLPKPVSEYSAAFIPNAADPYEDKWFVEADRQALRGLGISFVEVDLVSDIDWRTKLEKADLIYVAGGNSFYLLQVLRESGADAVLSAMVDKGIVYVGGSAGAAVAGISIAPVANLDEPEKAPQLKSTDGLGLVDFAILPHYGKEKYRPKFEQIFAEWDTKQYRLLTLSDEQTLVVRDQRYEVLTTKLAEQ